jgi:hypothetical protein
MESDRQPSKRRVTGRAQERRRAAPLDSGDNGIRQLSGSEQLEELTPGYAGRLQRASEQCASWLIHVQDVIRSLDLTWHEQERIAWNGETDEAVIALEAMGYTARALMELDKERICLETQQASIERRAEALRAYQNPTVG